MTTLPPGLLHSLRVTAEPRVLLIRHADRHAIPPGDSGVEVGLTSLGEQRARLLSRYRPQWALSSPLRRCVLTCSLAGVEPTSSHLLGAPGPFVVDRQHGGKVFETQGTETTVRRFLEGETWGCMRPLTEGARLVVDELTRALGRGGTGLAVSHDAIVMPVVTWLTSDRFENDWLEPLDGLVLDREGIAWRGQRYGSPV